METNEIASNREDVRPVLIRMIVPVAISLLFIGSTGIVDSIFVGQLGGEAVTAIGFAMPIVILATQIVIGFGVGVTSVVARASGAGDEAAARRLTMHSGAGGLLWILTMVSLGIWRHDQIFGWLGAEPNQLPLIRQFMIPWLLGVVGFFLVSWTTAAMRGLGDTRSSAVVFVVQALVNLAGEPVLVFGWGPFPALGIRGAALATVFSYACAAAVGVHLGHRQKLIGFPVALSGFGRSVAATLAVSAPAITSYILAPLTAGLVTALLARRGDDAVAAYGVATRIEGFLAMVPLAIGAGLGPFVGQHWASGQLSRLRAGVDFCRRLAFAWGALCYVGVAIAADPLSRIFADDVQMAPTVAVALRIVPLGFASYALIVVASAVYNNIGRASRTAMIAALRTVGFSVPLAIVADRVLGRTAVFAALAAASILAELVAARWLTKHGLRGAAATAAEPELGAEAPKAALGSG